MPKFLSQLIHSNKVVVHVPEHATVQEAARLMAEQNVGAVLIFDKENRLAGIFTERDLLRRVVAEGKDPRQTPISAVMTPDVIVARFDDSYETVLQTMNSTKCRHIPIVEGDQVRGVVSLRDLLRHDNEEKTFEASQLKDYFFHG